MPVWFNIGERAPSDSWPVNEWVTQWSFFVPNPADANRAAAGVVEYRTSKNGVPQEIHPGHPLPEILFVFKGKGVLQEGEKQSVIKEGDAIYVHAGTPHLIWTTSDDPRLALVAFRIPPGMGQLLEPGPPVGSL